MRIPSPGVILGLGLLAFAAGCKEPGDPPDPEVAPGAPATAEPGMTTGQSPEAVDDQRPGDLSEPMPVTPADSTTPRSNP
jgi:hypothetical protein